MPLGLVSHFLTSFGLYAYTEFSSTQAWILATLPLATNAASGLYEFFRYTKKQIKKNLGETKTFTEKSLENVFETQ